MKGITETLIMVFTDVQRFVDSEIEMGQFKQAEYYMNEGKEEIVIHSLGLRTRQYRVMQNLGQGPKAF